MTGSSGRFPVKQGDDAPFCMAKLWGSDILPPVEGFVFEDQHLLVVKEDDGAAVFYSAVVDLRGKLPDIEDQLGARLDAVRMTHHCNGWSDFNRISFGCRTLSGNVPLAEPVTVAAGGNMRLELHSDLIVSAAIDRQYYMPYGYGEFNLAVSWRGAGRFTWGTGADDYDNVRLVRDSFSDKSILEAIQGECKPFGMGLTMASMTLQVNMPHFSEAEVTAEVKFPTNVRARVGPGGGGQV
ncbi:hypothetical protein DIPPA_08106 [Diplonema papillatum]|nr:hypothetical protein DIPPA_08106 [Diplonema papillatum]